MDKDDPYFTCLYPPKDLTVEQWRAIFLSPKERERKIKWNTFSGRKRFSVSWKVYQEFGFIRCYCCENPVLPCEMTLEHIKPRYLGGTNDISNLAISHQHCNMQRGNIEQNEKMEMMYQWLATELSQLSDKNKII